MALFAMDVKTVNRQAIPFAPLFCQGYRLNLEEGQKRTNACKLPKQTISYVSSIIVRLRFALTYKYTAWRE